MTVDTLKLQEIDEVMRLFCKCFSNDHYYAQLFPDAADRAEKMTGMFKPTVEYCIQEGECLGVKQGNSLIAFILCFDYLKARDFNIKMFRYIFTGDELAEVIPYEAELHAPIVSLGGHVMYLLSVAVAPEFRKRGIASALVDMMMRKYRESYFVSDVSNQASLGIYEKRNFAIERIDEAYYLVIHSPAEPFDTFLINDTVKVAIPLAEILKKYNIAYKELSKAKAIYGYSVQTCKGMKCFVESRGSIEFATIVELEYEQYLKYQRMINVSNYAEELYADFVVYSLVHEYTDEPLYNPTLADMLKNRQTEWALIPDVYVSIPVRYTSKELVENVASEDSKAKTLLKYLDFRTHYEAGIPSDVEKTDDQSAFKRRIKRYYLGKIRAQIATEITVENYAKIGESIGPPAYIDMYISVDEESCCGVLTWYSLSSPFLFSHLLDNIIRNQLTVIVDGQCENIYDYLNRQFGIIKRGTPKIFSVIPKAKDFLQSNQIASLLAAETIYPDGENFGNIIDSDILSAISSEYGMGQYDRAYVCAYTNVVLQFDPTLKASLKDRMCEESITLFYIELIMFEEAAIRIADQEVNALFTSDVIKKQTDFLKKAAAIYDEYSRTIVFWDLQVNYPTSQKSINMLREAFGLKELLNSMQRNTEQLRLVFETKCDIADREEANRTNASLAVISILAVISAWMDGHTYIETWNKVFSAGTIYILQKAYFGCVLFVAVYVAIRLFGKKRNSVFLRTNNKKSIKNTKKKKRL